MHLVVPSPQEADPVAAYARTGAALAGALRDAEVARTVFQSSVGAERRHGVGEIDGLARVEEALDEAGLTVTHLCCGYFFTNLLMDLDAVRSGVLTTLLPTDQPLPWVAPDDIAAVAAGLLLHDGWIGRRVQAVHGPADLTWAEVAEVVGAATGRQVRAERVADETVREQLRDVGMGEAQVECVVGMSTGLRDGFVPEQPRDAVSTTPTPLAAWAHAVLRPALGGGG